MRTTLAFLAAMLLALAAPAALAQDNETNNIDVDFPGTDGEDDTVNVDADGDDGEAESVAAGLGNTTLIILVVLGILVIALVVVLASRP